MCHRPERKGAEIDARCLRGNLRATIRLALLQPKAQLALTQARGPHYRDDQGNEAMAKLLSFVELSNSKGADVAVVPEFFTSAGALRYLIDNPEALREGTLYVLPVESLAVEVYEDLLATLAQSDWDEDFARGRTGQNFSHVNICVILHRSGTKRQALVQLKTYCSHPELPSMKPGQEFFCTEGENSSLLVMLCSDANNDNFHEAWLAAADRKPGTLLVHAQCNPVPEYPSHENLWRRMLTARLAEHRLIVSLNWARGTEVVGEEQSLVIHRSRSRIMRGRVLEKNLSRLRELSLAGLHYHRREIQKRQWDVWHLADSREHALVVDIVPPAETEPAEQGFRTGVTSCQLFEFADDRFSQRAATDLSEKFWQHCERCDLERHHYASLANTCLDDTERFCNSCAMRQIYKWIDKDPAERIPTAQMFCTSDSPLDCDRNDGICCERRDSWLEDTDLVVECLESFGQSPASDGLRPLPTDRYPLNVVDEFDDPVGWLFHGNGRRSRVLQKKLGNVLSNAGVLETRGQVKLFPVGLQDSLNPDDIAAPEITEESEIGQDILASAHQVRLEVIDL